MSHYCLENLEPRQLLAGGDGLVATFYNNNNFSGTEVSRVDAAVNFNFGTKGPATNIAGDTWVARWTGKIQAEFSETYTFKIVSDDGARLWINHKLILGDWGQGGLGTQTGTVGLTAGQKYDIMIEYREKTGSAQIQFLWSSPSRSEQVVPSSQLFSEQADLNDLIDHAYAFAGQQLRATLTDLGARRDRFPEITNADGTWKTVDVNTWTSGFFGGALWQMQQRTAEEYWRLIATEYTKAVESAKTAPDDTGFRIMPTFGGLYRAMAKKVDRLVIVAAAQAKLAQFDSTVGMFRSVNHKPTSSTDARANFPVLMDHTMDLELIYTAARMQTRPDWAELANRHLEKLQQSMVRSNGSTIQWGYFYDQTGAFISAETRQGISGQTTWSRGQSWGMYSFVSAFAETRRSDFLSTAKKLCDYWINNVPPDGIPYWDFNATTGASTPRDSSAAAVAASAMIKLSQLLTGADAAKYKQAAETILRTLLAPSYLADGSTSRGVILHGVRYFAQGAIDNSLIYGDYYLLEAMNRYSGINV
jgi:unsaturated chondroitin disaccharide hydrolase